MFYEVKVLDGKGNVKKVISPKALSNRFWRDHLSDGQSGGTRATSSVSDLDFEPKDETVEEETPE
jgi:hypothetical protein